MPFTGEGDEAALAFCAAWAEDPTTRGALEEGATTGAWADFFGAPAAEAYEVAVGALVVVAGIGVCWFAGDVIWGAAIRDAENEGLVGVLILDFFFLGWWRGQK